MSRTFTREYLLSIAGITGTVRIDLPAAAGNEFHERYQDFLIPPAAWVGRDVSLSLSARENTAASPGDVAPEVHSDEKVISISRWDFDAQLKLDREGRWSGSGSIRPNIYSIDSLLRILWSVLLRHESGALVHACGLRSGDDGVLFPGVSGAGKTTLARKAALESVLSDEMVPIRRTPEGWRIYASPFWGEFGKGRGSLAGSRLAGVGFLKQAPRLSVEPMPSAEAAQRLLETLLCFEVDPETVRRNVELSFRLATEVPVFLASSALETPVAELLRELVPASPAAGFPRTSREAISEIRGVLRSSGRHAIVTTGGSMRPAIRSGDTLFIQSAATKSPVVGDVLVYWIPGETEDEDTLICHRMLAGGRGSPALTKGDALASFERVRDGCEAEILGTVVAVSRDGEVRPIRGRLGKMASALASLVAVPVVKLREALR